MKIIGKSLWKGEFLQQAMPYHGMKQACWIAGKNHRKSKPRKWGGIREDSEMGTCISRGQAKDEGTTIQRRSKAMYLQQLYTYPHSRQVKLLKTPPCQPERLTVKLVLLPAPTNNPLLPNGPRVWLHQGETDRSTYQNELTTNNVRIKNPS